jgi:UrcA family protein
MHMSQLVKIVGATLPLAFAGATARADNHSTSFMTRSTTVSYGDLDLSRRAGVDTLYRRIVAAGNSICAPKADPRDLVAYRDWQQCLEGAVDDAVATVANPTLSQMHLDRTGRAVPSAS